jgi:hypothetical protein
MTRTDAAVVRKQVVVRAPVEQAFAAFTGRFGDIKPPEHNLLAAAIVETSSSRTPADTSTTAPPTAVNAGGPGYWPTSPARVVFSSDIGPQWQVETNPELTSEVEVRFVAQGPDRTLVELEHRHPDRHGPGWQSVSEGVDGDQWWPLYLARFAAVLAANVEALKRRVEGPQQRNTT